LTGHARIALPDHDIRSLDGHADYNACVELQELTWGPGFSERVPPVILQTAQRLGGVAVGAFSRDGTLDGFVFGMTGWRDGAPLHWSDMLAVRAAVRGRGIGEALKRHQREVLLGRGVTDVEWTFEPLESRNAHVNFGRLGVVARQYVRDFYGDSDSPLHADLGTDRLVVHWRLDERRVEDRLAGRSAPPTIQEVADVTVINRVLTVDGLPGSEDARIGLDDDRLLLAIPADLGRLRDADPVLVRRWRAVVRSAFEAYLPLGWQVVDLVRAGDWSAYLLERMGRSHG
jgi:predicted GNAT superfamily acetyltransferase